MDHIKIIAGQAYSINVYKNIRTKIMKCCANIYFNQQCLKRKIIPKYANLNVPNTSPAAQMTKKKIHITRIKDEIKFLHIQKQKLNTELYNAHLKAALEWGNIWHTIMESILVTVNQEANKKYKTINTKLNQLMKTQTNNLDFQKQFYPRVINNTSITFTNDEMSLLNKGLKYNLGHKNKGWITTLALEAETAISQLPHTEQDYVRYQVAHNIKQLYKKHNESQPYNTVNATKEKHTVNKIKQKLITNNAMITKADKGNSIIIIYQRDYHDKVHKFIKDNNFTTLINDPTKTFQKELRNTVNRCQELIKKRINVNT